MATVTLQFRSDESARWSLVDDEVVEVGNEGDSTAGGGVVETESSSKSHGDVSRLHSKSLIIHSINEEA